MPNLTILTPISLDHRAVFAQAEASVLAQTIPVLHFAMLDTHSRGPGYIRNRLLEQVTTPYVSWLDSDDWLEPTFAEIMLKYARSYRYLFSDWIQDGQPIKAHAKPFCVGRFHLVTAVYPTDVIRAVGGFDENLRGMEDTELALKVMARGVCGVRIPRALVHYRRAGGRSHDLHKSGEIDALQAEIDRRYGGIRMPCCGDNTPIPITPEGEQRPGDVLAQAQWGGNHPVYGKATGRYYGRTSWPKTVWIDPRDAQASPREWQVVPEPGEDDSIDLDEEGSELRGAAALVARLEQAGHLKPAPAVLAGKPGPIQVEVRPDFARVKALVGEGETIEPAIPIIITPYATPEKLNDTTAHLADVSVPFGVFTDIARAPDPIFVLPSRMYPSYSDFWSLVKLAGDFKVIERDVLQGSEPQLYGLLDDDRYTLIFVGPEDIPDCSNARARTIFWQLEYTGDYTQQANINTVDEVWSSDPEHARRTGAKYVLLGSDRRLNKHWNKVKPKPLYDIVTLAYLTDRRRAIYEQLRGAYTFAPDYPGHDGDKRHDILRRSRLMLHVHQHDTPAHTPLRYALAAAYRLPLISEEVPSMGVFYPTAIPFSSYNDLVAWTQSWLETDHLKPYGESLYNLLCIDNPFEKCVREALANA